MWSTFFLVLIASILIVYLPGYFFFRGIGLARVASLSIAPAYSLFAFGTIAVLLSFGNISASGAVLFGTSFGVGAFCYLIKRLRQRKTTQDGLALHAFDTKRNFALLAGYVLFALAIAMFVYVKQLDGATAFAEEYDNYYHLSVVRSFLDSGNYSFLDATLYPCTQNNGLSPWGASTTSYYPALWHALVATVVSLTNCPLTLGVNAINTVIAAVIFPCGIFFLLRIVFKENSALLAGMFVCVAFSAYPWGLIMYGPLFPNLLGYALLPTALALSVEACRMKGSLTHRATMVLNAALALGAMVMAHPNTAFSFGVLILPFLLALLWNCPIPEKLASSPWRSNALHSFLVLLGLTFAAGVWIALYNAPFLQGVINFSWQPFASKTQAIANIILTQLTAQSAPQIVLSIAILSGVAYTLTHREHLWLTFSMFFVAIIYFFCACASSEGFLRHFFSGFWYTDIYRIAAMYAIAAIPLASVGIAAIFKWLLKLFPSPMERAYGGSIPAGCLVALALLIVNFFPNYYNYGVGETKTAFGILESRISEENNYVYDIPEKKFIEQVQDIVGNDLVLNDPFDGSAFLYGSDGLNVYYRQFYKYDANSETTESKLVRLELSNYAGDNDVRNAVSAIGAKYVLMLDTNNGTGTDTRATHWDIYGSYKHWGGFYDLTDDTPGFELILAEDDMRLYKINND